MLDIDLSGRDLELAGVDGRRSGHRIILDSAGLRADLTSISYQGPRDEGRDGSRGRWVLKSSIFRTELEFAAWGDSERQALDPENVSHGGDLVRARDRCLSERALDAGMLVGFAGDEHSRRVRFLVVDH